MTARHTTGAAIEIHQLVKQYKDVAAVDHVDLTVNAGEVFGFLGPNGAGKSTTIRCILDLARPTSGRISVLGLDSRRDSLKIRRDVGYLPGDLALYDKLTGREVIDYFANLRGGVARDAIDVLAERFRADLSRPCGEYSSGNRQKIGLIQAFMHQPDLVILDEPSVGLDPLVQQELQDLIKEVRAEGRSVFLSSHALSEVEHVADRVGIIRHGLVVEVAKIDDLKARAIRRLDLEFSSDDTDLGALRDVPGVREVTRDGRIVTVSYDGMIEAVLEAVIRLGVTNLHSRDVDLEQIFLAYYRDPDTTTGATNSSDVDLEH